VKPVLQALVLADRVYQDVSGKKIIAGTFNRILFGIPSVREVDLPDGTKQRRVMGGVHSGSPYAYVSLTDVCQGTKLKLQFVNLSKNAVLFGTAFEVSPASRLETVELVLALPPLPISEPGIYSLEVLWENEILGSHRITAERIEEKG
jgi:hypothetical protein